MEQYGVRKSYVKQRIRENSVLRISVAEDMERTQREGRDLACRGSVEASWKRMLAWVLEMELAR